MTPDTDTLLRLAEAATQGERASGFAHWGKYDLTIPVPNQDRIAWRGLFINGVPHIKICDHVLSKEDSDYLLATQPAAMIALCKRVKEQDAEIEMLRGCLIKRAFADPELQKEINEAVATAERHNAVLRADARPDPDVLNKPMDI